MLVPAAAAMTDRARATASGEGVKMVLMVASCSAWRAALPVSPSLRLAVASVPEACLIGLEVGHIDRGDAACGRGSHDHGTRVQQVFPRTFGTEVGREITAAQEQATHALVSVCHAIGDEHGPGELDHRDNADTGLRTVKYVRYDPDLVRRLTLRNDNRVGLTTNVVKREQVAKPFHRARTIDAQ